MLQDWVILKMQQKAEVMEVLAQSQRRFIDFTVISTNFQELFDADK